MPKVYVTNDPSELILIDGEPKYEPVPNTGLLWISNTESDLFRLGKDGPVYYLVAGRWFTAPGLGGHWTFATPHLPEDFKRISVEHPRSRVLASVPGTQQAAEAVLLAEIPQFARVNKKEITAPEVIYQGDPQFQPIKETTLQRAINTDKEIIKVGETYYMCYQGVWFQANTAKGPWTLATSVPQEVYQIPPSSPSHSVTYVTVQPDEDDSDDWVTYAAYAGYSGVMIGWGCAMWGTGWYYPPYYGTAIDLLPVLAHLWLWRLVQRVHRCLRNCRKNIWTIRRRRLRRSLQPEHRHLCAGRVCVWTIRSTRRRAGI